jgi:general secretion pathway protein G
MPYMCANEQRGAHEMAIIWSAPFEHAHHIGWAFPKMRANRSILRSFGFTLIEALLAIGIIAVLVSIALPKYQDHLEQIRIDQAISDIAAISGIIAQFSVDRRGPPDTLAEVGNGGKLDPWGRPYEYFNLVTSKGNGKARKDKKLNPLNSDFDLYSVGKDGDSKASLVPPASRDDVLRARDGRFIGLASDFDP